MKDTVIGKNTTINKAIIAENVKIGDNVTIGVGDEVPNENFPKIYSFGIATVGEDSVIPDNVTIGKNTAISGITTNADYADNVLASGKSIIKAGE